MLATVRVMGEHISFTSNGGTCGGYLANGGGPGVIVIQEWWGLVPHIEDLTNRFAAEGFVALAPDLYHGQKTTSPGPSIASARWPRPSLEPMVTIASVSMSSSTA